MIIYNLKKNNDYLKNNKNKKQRKDVIKNLLK